MAVAVAAVILAVVSRQADPRVARRTDVDDAWSSLTLATASPAVERPTRPIYRHSVIPGGVYSSQELVEATERDPVVFAQYGSAVRYAPMRVATSFAPRRVYMSYRIGDRVYWTKEKVSLNAGETTLTNGDVQIRARCGNRISETAMLPVSESEPDVVEFDGLAADEPELLAQLDSARLVGIGSVLNASTSAMPPISGAGPPASFGGPGGGGFVFHPPGAPTTNTSPAAEEPPPPVEPPPPDVVPPGNTPDPPTTGEPPDEEPEPPGPELPPDEPPPPNEPPPTVPEPGTFVFLGTALAGFGAVRLRRYLRRGVNPSRSA